MTTATPCQLCLPCCSGPPLALNPFRRLTACFCAYRTLRELTKVDTWGTLLVGQSSVCDLNVFDTSLCETQFSRQIAIIMNSL